MIVIGFVYTQRIVISSVCVIVIEFVQVLIAFLFDLCFSDLTRDTQELRFEVLDKKKPEHGKLNTQFNTTRTYHMPSKNT